MSDGTDLLSVDARGLHCPAGDFHLDPWEPVPTAVITHAHGDHARPGSGVYHCTQATAPLLRHRLEGAEVIGHPPRQPFTLGQAQVSFHPSGHLLGAAQVRVEAAGQVWVFSGDYKRAPDPTCEPFEPVRCDTFITEATFALPIFRWDPPPTVVREIFEWWEQNRRAGRASALFCYALGKAQRVLAELTAFTDRRVFVHGAVEPLVALYREQGVRMLPTEVATTRPRGTSFAGELILAPLSARGAVWMRRFGDRQEAFVSGWMQLRGTRRRRAFDRGFVLSDHADWPALLQTVEDSGAQRILVTHGYAEVLSRYLREKGLEARALATPFQGEAEDP